MEFQLLSNGIGTWQTDIGVNGHSTKPIQLVAAITGLNAKSTFLSRLCWEISRRPKAKLNQGRKIEARRKGRYDQVD